jgi:hypothetical protein
MPDQPRLAGGARPRAAATAGPADARVRVTLTPPGEGEAVSVWAERTAAGLVLAADVPGLAVGWRAAWRGFEGLVAGVDGRAVAAEPAWADRPAGPETPPAEEPAPAPRRRK